MTVFVYISFAQAATCSYKHTRMHKQMSDKHVYHTLRDTHTCILRQRVRSRAQPAARDLWENRTPPVLFIFPSRANTEPPSNCSRLRLLSLIQTLIATCLLFFCLMEGFFSPPAFFPSQSSFHCIWSQSARFHAMTSNHIKVFCGRLSCVPYLESLWWWGLIIQASDWG